MPFSFPVSISHISSLSVSFEVISDQCVPKYELGLSFLSIVMAVVFVNNCFTFLWGVVQTLFCISSLIILKNLAFASNINPISNIITLALAKVVLGFLSKFWG